MSFLIVLLIFASPRAYCVANASKSDKSAINDRIRVAKELESKIAHETVLLNHAKDAQEQNSAQKEIEKLRLQRAAAYNEAIYLALAAYEIIPPGGMPKGKVVMRSTNLGKIVTWLPMFEDNFAKPLVNEVGRIQTFHREQDALAQPSSDGVTRVYPETFEYADELALILVHEKVHFDQIVTPGRADLKTLGEREVEAYSVEQDIVNSNLFEMPDWEKDAQDSRVKTQLAKNERRAEAERAAVDKAKGLPLPEYDFKSHTSDELKAIRQGAAELRDQIARERLERLGPVRDPRNDVWGLAERICSDPRHAKQDELDSVMDALIAFCRQNSCGLAEAENQPCAGKLQSAMFQEARRGHRIPLDLLEKQGPVQWIDLSQIRGPGCYDTCLALAKVANAACDDPESVSQEELDGILANDDGALYAQNIAILECPSKLLEAMMRAKKGGRRIRADWLKAMARRIGPKDYRFEEALIAFSEKACRYSVDHDDAIDLKRLRGAPVRTPPDPPSDPCAAYVYSKLSGMDDLPQYPEDYAIRLVGSWRASQQPPVNISPDDDRDSNRTERLPSHNIPDRRWSAPKW